MFSNPPPCVLQAQASVSWQQRGWACTASHTYTDTDTHNKDDSCESRQYNECTSITTVSTAGLNNQKIDQLQKSSYIYIYIYIYLFYEISAYMSLKVIMQSNSLYLRLCVCMLCANSQPYWQRLFSLILLTIPQIVYLFCLLQIAHYFYLVFVWIVQFVSPFYHTKENFTSKVIIKY